MACGSFTAGMFSAGRSSAYAVILLAVVSEAVVAAAQGALDPEQMATYLRTQAARHALSQQRQGSISQYANYMGDSMGVSMSPGLRQGRRSLTSLDEYCSPPLSEEQISSITTTTTLPPFHLTEFLDHSSSPQTYPATTPSRYPYIVNLGYDGVDGPLIGCLGVLISADVVLTAAHCAGAKEAYIARSDGTLYEHFKVDKQETNPGYAKLSDDFDTALMKLDALSSSTPARLDVDNLASSLQPDEALRVVGYGPEQYSLQDPEVHVVENYECAATYNGWVFGDMMCAALPNKVGACQGDSGGPLLLPGDSPASDVVVGVSSWGFQCPHGGMALQFPGVYSRVHMVGQWIANTIKAWGAAPLPTPC
eukprot:scaffold286770_cov37-Prasinocladus_malaysianus.AAC.1